MSLSRKGDRFGDGAQIRGNFAIIVPSADFDDNIGTRFATVSSLSTPLFESLAISLLLGGLVGLPRQHVDSPLGGVRAESLGDEPLERAVPLNA